MHFKFAFHLCTMETATPPSFLVAVRHIYFNEVKDISFFTCDFDACIHCPLAKYSNILNAALKYTDVREYTWQYRKNEI